MIEELYLNTNKKAPTTKEDAFTQFGYDFKQLGVEINHTKPVFEKQPSVDKINLTLAILADRKIDCGHCVKFSNKYYKLVDANNNPIYFRKGTDALVVKAFNDGLYVSICNKIYGLEEIKVHRTKSKKFDFIEDKPKKNKRYLPLMSPPWKHASFQAYLDK